VALTEAARRDDTAVAAAPCERRRPNPVPGAVLRFLAPGVLVMVLVGVTGYNLLRNAYAAESVRDARDVAADVASRVRPAVTDGLAAGNPRDVAHMDAVVRMGLLGIQVVAVKVRNSAGLMVYSSDPAQEGLTFPLDAQDAATLASGTVRTELGAEPDADDPPSAGLNRAFIKVYEPMRTPGGTPLLLESYLEYSHIRASADRVFRLVIPALVAALVLLELLQLPLAVSLARRVRRAERDQDMLLRRALIASDSERRRIAADLHDGVVQDLAALNYTLVDAAHAAKSADDAGLAVVLRQAAAATRTSIQALRTLFVEIYPPNLRQTGLPSALADLVAPLISAGISVRVDIDDAPQLDEHAEALVYRVAQEALRNIAQHAQAAQVTVNLSRQAARAVLVVTDDGVGFASESLFETPHGGHVGLRLLSELASDAGGSLVIDSQPGSGTRLTLEVPA
jgi:signal transduction histidine kinase